MKFYLFIFIFLLTLSCESIQESSSQIYTPTNDGSININNNFYGLSDYVSEVLGSGQSCYSWVASFRFVIFEKSQNVKRPHPPYDLYFLFPMNEIHLNEIYFIEPGEFDSEMLETCFPEMPSNYIFIEKNYGDSWFYPQESVGRILENPTGSILLKTYDLQSNEYGNWVGYKIDFDLNFTSSEGQPLSVSGQSEGKLWIGDAVDRQFVKNKND
jgi:hypothetical protein